MNKNKFFISFLFLVLCSISYASSTITEFDNVYSGMIIDFDGTAVTDYGSVMYREEGEAGEFYVPVDFNVKNTDTVLKVLKNLKIVSVDGKLISYDEALNIIEQSLTYSKNKSLDYIPIKWNIKKEGNNIDNIYKITAKSKHTLYITYVYLDPKHNLIRMEYDYNYSDSFYVLGNKSDFKTLISLHYKAIQQVNYSNEKSIKLTIYKSEEASEAATENPPRKEYKTRMGIIKNQTDLYDGYLMHSNSKGFFVPVSTQLTLDKDNLVLVYEGEEDEDTFRVYVFSDAPEPRGRMKKKDISFDTEDFKNSSSSFFFNSIPAYEDINGKRLVETADGFGFIEERKDGWLRVWILGEDEYWIKESDMNYDYSLIEYNMNDIYK